MRAWRRREFASSTATWSRSIIRCACRAGSSSAPAASSCGSAATACSCTLRVRSRTTCAARSTHSARFLAENVRAYPSARVFGAPGLREKLAGARIDEVLADEPPDAWAADLDQILVTGAPSLNEVVFLHRASRTLVCLDLCFNVRESASLVTRAFMRANGAWGRFGPSRIFRFAVMKDRRAMRASIDRILAWDFDRVTVAHGEILETGGREALGDSFAWLRA
jgi:hypothetical protein